MSSKISGVAEEVRVLMARNRMNQRGLAGLLQISEATASRRVRGIEPFTLPELFTIAEHFDVPITALFGGADGGDDGYQLNRRYYEVAA